MPGHNFNHFTGKRGPGNPLKNRKNRNKGLLGHTTRRKGSDTYFRDFMRILRRRYGDGGDIRYCGSSVGQ